MGRYPDCISVIRERRAIHIPTISSSRTAPLILIVEDEPSLRTIYRSALERAGFAVRTVDNGADALTDIEREPPDLIVLDLGLPQMRGEAVIRALASRQVDIPIVVVTGDAFVPALPVARILRKPFYLRELVTSVEAGVRRPALPSR
jgi:DNA-binding response OmpR family regulator